MKADILKQSELTNEALCALFNAEGNDARLDDDGDVKVSSPSSSNVMYVDVQDLSEDGRLQGIFFFALFTIPETADDETRDAFCNRINEAQPWLTAFCPKPGSMRLSYMLPVAHGIGKRAIIVALNMHLHVNDHLRDYDEDNVIGHGAPES